MYVARVELSPIAHVDIATAATPPPSCLKMSRGTMSSIDDNSQHYPKRWADSRSRSDRTIQISCLANLGNVL